MSLSFLVQPSVMAAIRWYPFSRRRRTGDATLQSARHTLRTPSPNAEVCPELVSGSGHMRGEGWGYVAKEVTRCFSDTGGLCRRYGARIKRTFGRRGSGEGMPAMLRSIDFSTD